VPHKTEEETAATYLWHLQQMCERSTEHESFILQFTVLSRPKFKNTICKICQELTRSFRVS